MNGEQKINTPYYEIHTDILDKNISVFKDALKTYWKNSEIAYSVKTNSLPWLLKYMLKNNILAEVVSDEEYELAKKCGFLNQNIVFNGPIKTVRLIDYSVKNKSIVNIDSKREVEYIKKNSSVSDNIGIRINVNPEIFDKEDIGYTNDGFRFGFSEENGELKKVLEAFGYPNKKITNGIHLHCNSITRSINVYKKLAEYCIRILKKYNWYPSYIDLGGGFFGGVSGKPSAYEYMQAIIPILEKFVDKKETKLIVEPGSAIIGSAVDFHTSVIDVKDTVYSRIITTDGSRINIDPLWKKTNYNYSLNTKIKTTKNKQIICGYTCMDHDRVMIINNEKELSVEDEIIYHKVGAYTITFGGPFIRYLPDVYININGRLEKIRNRMSVEDYYNIQSFMEKI